ncbi:MAG TPA: hypothetical protein VJ916_04150 [Anaerovoracaceae bacterium]|nr:hypothetical protein [Anaerovoracaceae bacterium]
MKKLITLLIIITLGLGAYSFLEYKDQDMLYLTVPSIDIEYGETLDVHFEDYIDTSILSDEEKQEVMKNTTITSNVDFKDKVLEIGEYLITYKYYGEEKNEVRKIKVNVADTLPPEFNEVSVIKTSVGKQINYSEHIEATDYAGIDSIKYYAEDVNFDRAGEYKLLVIAKDVNGNVAEKKIDVIVK